MTMDEKKKLIKQFVRLGMDDYSAMVAAECSPEEIEMLEADTEYKRYLTVVVKLEERRLLDRFDKIMEKTADMLDSKDLKWKLSKINPERWGDGKVAKGSNSGFRIILDFGGKQVAFDKTEDNLEIFDPDDELEHGIEERIASDAEEAKNDGAVTADESSGESAAVPPLEPGNA